MLGASVARRCAARAEARGCGVRRGASGVWRWWLVAVIIGLLAIAWASGLQAQTPAAAGWVPVASGVDVDLYDVHFPSPDVGYAVGDQHTILRTADRGATWTPQGFRRFRKLWAVRALTDTRAWAVGDEGTIVLTTTGGPTWESATTDTLHTFYGLSLVGLPENPISIQYSLAVGALGTARSTEVLGRSWRIPVNLPPAGGLSRPNLYGVDVRGGTVGVIVGERAIYYRTADGAWIGSGRAETLYGVHLVDETTGWAVGTNGTILKTSDAGASWTAQASGTTATLYDVHFVDRLRGWVVGAGGTILATRDGGTTWQPQESGVSADLRGVWFTGADEGWVVGGGGVILRTTTGGQPAATPHPTATATRPGEIRPAPTPTATPAAPRVWRLYLPTAFRAFKGP